MDAPTLGRRHEGNGRGIGSVSHISTMRVRITGFGRRAARSLFKRTVRPIGGRRFVQSAEQTARNKVQQQVSGNPHPPHGGNARGLPVFDRLTVLNTSHTFFLCTTILLTCYRIWGEPGSGTQRLEMERRERESTKARQDNARQMCVEWSSMHPSREAVLNKTYKSNLSFILRKLLGWVKKSEADKATRAPKCVTDVIRFFLRWKNHCDDDTIDSARLKKNLGAEFFDVRDTLKEIRDDEASDWHDADSDNLSEVVDFLDEISKVETKGSGES